MARGDLSAKQKRFCEEYVIDLNGTKAAIRAGYAPKNADVTAAKYLGISKVKEYIYELQAKINNKNEGLAQKVINELVKIGFQNIQEVLEPGNKITDIATVNKDVAAAVASVKTTTTYLPDGSPEITTELKMHNKIAALDKLGQHLGLWKDKLELSGGVNITWNETKTYEK